MIYLDETILAVIRHYGVACGGNWTQMYLETVLAIEPERVGTKQFSFVEISTVLREMVKGWPSWGIQNGARSTRIRIKAKTAEMALKLLGLDGTTLEATELL